MQHTPQLGIFSFALLVAFCMLPFHWLGLSFGSCVIGGSVVAFVVIGAAANYHRNQNVKDMQEAYHNPPE